MTPRQQEKLALLAHIDRLLEEANTLPRTKASWERRQEIDWELLQLFRRIGNLSAGPQPYWSDPAEDVPVEKNAGEADAHPAAL